MRFSTCLNLGKTKPELSRVGGLCSARTSSHQATQPLFLEPLALIFNSSSNPTLEHQLTNKSREFGDVKSKSRRPTFADAKLMAKSSTAVCVVSLPKLSGKADLIKFWRLLLRLCGPYPMKSYFRKAFHGACRSSASLPRDSTSSITSYI